MNNHQTWSQRSDPYKDVPFAEDVPMQKWEKIFWAFLVGFYIGLVCFI
jgi:hypothetical protein